MSVENPITTTEIKEKPVYLEQDPDFISLKQEIEKSRNVSVFGSRGYKYSKA